jgi:membrane fusion protein (multidrug efflux system)
VEVLVSFTDSAQPRVGGLYAEGNIAANKVTAISLPDSVLVKAGDKVSVWRVKDKKLNKVDLTLGARDSRTGYIEVRTGLADGDVVLRTPSSNFKEGQEVEPAAPLKTATAASAPAQGK